VVLSPDKRSLLTIKAIMAASTEAMGRLQDIYDGLTVSMAHDAVEQTLWTVARDANLSVSRRADFDELRNTVSKYFDTALGKRLPNENKLKQLNSVRISYKHDGVLPKRTEVERLFEIVRSFVEEVVADAYGIDIGHYSEADLVSDASIRDALAAFQAAIEIDNLPEAAVELAWAKKRLEELAATRAPSRGFSAPRFDLPTQDHRMLRAANDAFRYINEVHAALFKSIFFLMIGASATDYARIERMLPSVYKTGDGRRHSSPRVSQYTKEGLQDCERMICKFALAIEARS
jgi:hypothetical protein